MLSVAFAPSLFSGPDLSKDLCTEFILMIPHRLVQKREYQAASISQDEEMKFGRLYIFVNTWLLYPELEDLNHQGFFC